jgi:hypothetical protein
MHAEQEGEAPAFTFEGACSMPRFIGTIAMATVALQLPQLSPAQDKGQPTKGIFIYAPSGWMLTIESDGSGLLQYGSLAFDGWRFKAGTIDAAQAEKDLRALKSDAKGGISSHFSFSFEAERKAPDQPGPARYTRDEQVVPGLFKAAVDATSGRNELNARRRAELLAKKPPAELPKQK